MQKSFTKAQTEGGIKSHSPKGINSKGNVIDIFTSELLDKQSKNPYLDVPSLFGEYTYIYRERCTCVLCIYVCIYLLPRYQLYCSCTRIVVLVVLVVLIVVVFD